MHRHPYRLEYHPHYWHRMEQQPDLEWVTVKEIAIATIAEIPEETEVSMTETGVYSISANLELCFVYLGYKATG